MKNKDKKLLVVLIIALVACLVLLVVAITTRNIKRSNTANRYDLNCVTELRANPLKDCKE